MTTKKKRQDRQVRIVGRVLVDEEGRKWDNVSFESYFLEDPAELAAIRVHIVRVLAWRLPDPRSGGLGRVITEILGHEADSMLTASVPSSTEFDGNGLRLFRKGSHYIALIEQVPC